MTFTFRNVTQALPSLASYVLDGSEVGSRLGERVKEQLFTQVVLTKPWEREVLVPGRKASIAAQLVETAWVLAGRDDIERLLPYLPRAADFSDDGTTWRGAYGPRLRRWETNREGQCSIECSEAPFCEHASVGPVDQLQGVVDLLRQDPLSRRAVIAIYDGGRDQTSSKDIPCNDFIQFLSRDGKLHMHVYIRSNDLIWGWSGINQFEWSVLQEVVAHLLGVLPGPLSFTMGSLHVYDRHWEKAEQMIGAPALPNDPTNPPRFSIASPWFGPQQTTRNLDRVDTLLAQWFSVEAAIRTGAQLPWIDEQIKAFPEPMLRSWLRVIAHHWTGHSAFLTPLEGTRLYAAVRLAPLSPGVKSQRLAAVRDEAGLGCSEFAAAVTRLHIEKDAAYGDSWKRRGEMFSVIPNIARKVDRLGGGETDDETSADTACDLLVYLAKYRVFLSERMDGPIFRNWGGSDTPGAANEVILDIDRSQPLSTLDTQTLEGSLKSRFEELANVIENRAEGTSGLVENLVENMLRKAYLLARRLWEAEQEQRRVGRETGPTFPL